MKLFIVSLLFFCTSCVVAKETKYTASTPAGAVVKNFLGIPLNDSVDFIRWQLTLQSDSYTLQCNYGISKPNTNGFINGGTTIALQGKLLKEKNYYQLEYKNNHLKLAELNNDLLHVSDSDNSLLVGNGGWSYTLNNTAPGITGKINFTAKPNPVKDSMAFEGRTPCGIPGYIPAGQLCYKIKWYIILYGTETNNAGTWRSIRGKTGKWKTITGKDDQTIYQLNGEEGNGLLYLVKPDENILLFTDADGRLLTGNEDFSYTLNRLNRLK